MTEPPARQALGSFLRAHREGLPRPAQSTARRRTPGLRREELAEAAGLSLTWITWLEQGRMVSASADALARLAAALHLSPAERGYLFDLAEKRDPAATPPAEHLPGSVLALPERMTIPAYLLDRSWTALSWNPLAQQLFPGWLDGHHHRNLLHYLFLSPAAPRLLEDWDQRVRRIVAEFRADFSRGLRNPALLAMIDDLSTRSREFARLWRKQEVLSRDGGERRFRRPSRRYLQHTFILTSHSDIKLVTLTPLP